MFARMAFVLHHRIYSLYLDPSLHEWSNLYVLLCNLVGNLDALLCVLTILLSIKKPWILLLKSFCLYRWLDGTWIQLCNNDWLLVCSRSRFHSIVSINLLHFWISHVPHCSFDRRNHKRIFERCTSLQIRRLALPRARISLHYLKLFLLWRWRCTNLPIHVMGRLENSLLRLHMCCRRCSLLSSFSSDYWPC